MKEAIPAPWAPGPQHSQESIPTSVRFGSYGRPPSSLLPEGQTDKFSQSFFMSSNLTDAPFSFDQYDTLQDQGVVPQQKLTHDTSELF